MALFRLLDVEKKNDSTRVCIRTKEIHSHQFEKIRDQLFELLDQETPGKLILDLKEVQYAYSDLLELMLRLHKRMKTGGGKFIVSQVAPNVRDLIVATKLDQVIHLEPDEVHDEQ